MKKFIFTIIAIIFFGAAAEAQTSSAAGLEVSLENAINVKFSKGTALTTKAANAYTQAVKANNDKSFNVMIETAAIPYITNTTVPVKEIINTLVKSNAPCYIGSSYSISVF